MGYAGALRNWGVKWGACEVKSKRESDTVLIYQFCTAWGPPINFFKKIALDFQNLKFRLDYCEPLMEFSGTFIIQGNKVIKDEEREFDPDNDICESYFDL